MAGETRLRKHRQRSIWGGPPPSEEFPDGRAAYARHDSHYVIELSIPRTALAWADLSDTINQLDIAVNDRDSGGSRETQLTWSGNESNRDGSRYFGEVRLSGR